MGEHGVGYFMGQDARQEAVQGSFDIHGLPDYLSLVKKERGCSARSTHRNLDGQRTAVLPARHGMAKPEHSLFPAAFLSGAADSFGDFLAGSVDDKVFRLIFGAQRSQGAY